MGKDLLQAWDGQEMGVFQPFWGYRGRRVAVCSPGWLKTSQLVKILVLLEPGSVTSTLLLLGTVCGFLAFRIPLQGTLALAL